MDSMAFIRAPVDRQTARGSSLAFGQGASLAGQFMYSGSSVEWLLWYNRHYLASQLLASRAIGP
jgi:hypothetical protein